MDYNCSVVVRACDDISSVDLSWVFAYIPNVSREDISVFFTTVFNFSLFLQRPPLMGVHRRSSSRWHMSEDHIMVSYCFWILIGRQ